ncbi:MAG: arginine--tRNA ligase [Spirochaetaceae bacterium]|nr:arginine--tRNA ligase [Spirochaetaceae bacterium]
MDDKLFWKDAVYAALAGLAAEMAEQPVINKDAVIAEIPPDPQMGDLGFPMFPFAKIFRKAPPAIATLVAGKLAAGAASSLGPYVNIRFDRAAVARRVLDAVLNSPDNFCTADALKGSRVMVEFSSPNTNKPLHLGHLRNDALGESIARILAAAGAEVRKVCIINDRGIHICKSMLAYKECGNSATPESARVKSDRFVGDYYVRFTKLSQEDSGAEERAQELLRKWEAGDEETVTLWKKMNDWTVRGMKETYVRTGISFDQYYFESETYRKGKDEVLKGLEQGLWTREEDGSVQADLTADGLDKKVLLRKDGTSLYITQDFGTAILRHHDWPFDRLVYVVGSEQRYHFQVLFLLLDKMGFEWARNLYHLSYGMVNLPEGRMKSREGTVVDADDLINELRDMALEEIRGKEREEIVGDAMETAEKIALGALHYYLLQITPERDMLFNPQESLSFTGNTGPYLQYMGARISSILRRDEAAAARTVPLNAALLGSDEEWELIKMISQYPQAVESAAREMNPSLITAWLYELSKNFSRFYHAAPVLTAPNPELARARLALCEAVLAVLRRALNLVCIPFLESM